MRNKANKNRNKHKPVNRWLVQAIALSVFVPITTPQGRLTDHRINLTIYQLGDVMEGNLSLVIDSLQREYHAELLAELGRD